MCYVDIYGGREEKRGIGLMSSRKAQKMRNRKAQSLVNLGVKIGVFSALGLYALTYRIPWLVGVSGIVAFYYANEADKILRSMR